MIYIPSEKLLATGQLEIIVTDSSGQVKDHRNVKNTVTIIGKEYIANRMKNSFGTSHYLAPQMAFMAIGTGNTGATINNLHNEIRTGATDLGVSPNPDFAPGVSSVGGRVAISPSTNPGTVVGNSITYTATFPGATSSDPPHITANAPVTEAAIFNYSAYNSSPVTSYAASGPSLQFMLCRTSFLVVNKLVADTLTINWTVTIN